jgi:hypothetical protein
LPKIGAPARPAAGTRYAISGRMAAVFALVFVPALGAVLLMLGTLHGAISIGTLFATLVFFALTTGLMVGLFRLAHNWEEEGGKQH